MPNRVKWQSCCSSSCGGRTGWAHSGCMRCVWGWREKTKRVRVKCNESLKIFEYFLHLPEWSRHTLSLMKIFLRKHCSRVHISAFVEKTVRFGLREVELIQDYIDETNKTIGREFYFKINGQPVFLKGQIKYKKYTIFNDFQKASELIFSLRRFENYLLQGTNWIPVSPFPARNNSERMEFLLESSRIAGILQQKNVLKSIKGCRNERDARVGRRSVRERRILRDGRSKSELSIERRSDCFSVVYTKCRTCTL